MISTLWKNDRKKYVSVLGCQDNLMCDTKLAVRKGVGVWWGMWGGGWGGWGPPGAFELLFEVICLG